MIRNIDSLQHTTFDLLVIGGGINGAAIANIASQRGLKTALLEKGDFASGTSSKSTKLLHGGIRYLENLEFDLVHESLVERSIQLKSVPHLAKPLRFIIPVYKGDRRPLWMMRLGVFLYDQLAGKYRIGERRSLTASELHELEPSLGTDNLKGGVSYYDVQMDDTRICLENVLKSAKSGAKVLNYVQVLSFIQEEGRDVGVRAIDLLTQQHFEVRAKKIVCATGPWTNALMRVNDPHTKKLVRTTKGIHIVYKDRLTKNAILLTTKTDSRIFFIIPWLGYSLIGTTDTNYIGNPDQVKVEPQDIEYLFNEAKRFFPKIELRHDKIVTTFVGLRPLIRKGGAPSKVSRRHLIMEMDSGLIVVIGGKYTTYRRIAEECLNYVIVRSLRLHGATKQSLTKRLLHPFGVRNDDNIQYPLYGSGSITDNLNEIAQQYGLEINTIEALVNTYGTRFKDVLALTENRPQLKEPICTCTPFIKAQIVYSLETEMAMTPEDIIDRRLGLIYRACPTKNCERNITTFFKKM